MKRKCYTDEQVWLVLCQAEAETPVGAAYPTTGISEQTFYRWKKKFSGMGVAGLGFRALAASRARYGYHRLPELLRRAG